MGQLALILSMIVAEIFLKIPGIKNASEWSAQSPRLLLIGKQPYLNFVMLQKDVPLKIKK